MTLRLFRLVQRQTRCEQLLFLPEKQHKQPAMEEMGERRPIHHHTGQSNTLNLLAKSEC